MNDAVVKAVQSKVKLPTGYRFEVGGEAETAAKSFGGLGPIIALAVFGILAVLVIEFGRFRETLVVAGVIPLGLFGGLVALFVTGNSLSYTAVIGFVALIGIEIKNSLLLVDFTTQLREAGRPLREAIEEAGEVRFLPVLLTSVIRAHLDELFPGREVEAFSQFRVTRDSDLEVDEDDVKNLRQALRSGLSSRHFGQAIRLEVVNTCPASLSEFLLRQFDLPEGALYRVNGPVNLVRLMQVPAWVDRPELKFPPFTPALPARLAQQDDVFAHIRKNDILLHHPFESFQPVIDFIEQAAADPNVLAIRQTVYRTGTDSKLMMALIRAAQSGKEVTVVVELLARFDEEANINWAARLEEVGAHVVYGVVGHKTHAKLALVIRREDDVLRRYAHLGTGNYHARTARLYTDFGLLTADEAITADVNSLFTQITGLGKAGKL
ncbi:MAG: hypothetical protein B7Y33_03525, partial [Hydrogenophilales bacterium 16-62-9]